MNPVPHQTHTIHLDDLEPGTYLIDKHQEGEKVIRQVHPHGSFVRLFFEGDTEAFTCSIAELQGRFEIVYPPFRADANLVRLIAEAYRLQHAYLFNPIFATETSLIDPLPHQFIAVYDHLLKHFPLRFLLADDAGAGKTIMTGLYIQELLLRRQVERVLIVPPAGLIGNWERELRVCFRLQFQILSSASTTDTNPFVDSENRLAIVSLDTLRQERMQQYLFEAPSYDLVVFDEAHKLSARREWDGTVTKSKRYQIPWNPARIEQRMGRIHRYKQKQTVVLLNLVAQDTREGRVLKVLLEKLEQMRKELSDDKVFDVIGQQFSQVSLTELITQAITENKTDASIQTINNQFTSENIKQQLEAQQKLVACSEVKRLLVGVQKQRESAETLRMMPAYVRGFFEDAAPLVGYQIDGEVEEIFKLSHCPAFVQSVIEKYPPHLQNRLTFSRELALPTGLDQPQAIFLHPGESVFDSILTLFLGEFEDEGNRGAVYFDPQTDEPYLFYLAKVPVVRQIGERPQILDEVLVGVKQFSDERCESTPAHLLLTLTPSPDNGSSISPEWVDRADEVELLKTFVVENLGAPKVSHIRDELQSQLEEKRKQIQISSNLRKGELLKQRRALQDAVAKGVPAAQTKLNNCDRELDELEVKRAAAETSLVEEIENTELGTVTLYVRALVLPPPIDAVPTKTIRDAEAVALRATIEYEREHGAAVEDVSNPHLKKGFDLQSKRPNGEVRYIEVKGRTGITSVELTANEWRQAANHRDRYWLYVVYRCDTNPQLHRCQDPFENLIAKAKESVIINASDIMRESVS